MLRIDPSLSLVWRTPTSIQIGFPSPVVQTELIPPEEHLLVALRAGANWTSLMGLSEIYGLSPEDCRAFVRRIEPAFVIEAQHRQRVGIDGHGATAQAIARLLAATCDVRFINAAMVEHERLAPDRRISAHKRARIEKELDRWRPDAVVIVGTYAISGARNGVWLRREIPHLGVILGDRESRVGPFVRPGHGPCLSCVEMSAMDADPARLAMLAQLAGKPCGGETALVSAEVATIVARVLADELKPGEVMRLDATTGLWTVETTSTCSRCSCRALREIETVAVA
jgi:hypothetical protein